MHPNRLAIAAVCLTVLFMGCASGSGTTTKTSSSEGSSAAAAIPQVEVTANSLNVREGPTSSAAVVGSLKRGERVDAPKEAVDGWVWVEGAHGVSGYVSATYVKEVAPRASQPAERSAERAASRPAPGTKLAQVTEGMSSEKVREIMGPPDSESAYVTGKAWIPHYYGSDTSRAEWSYPGQGVVVFSRNRYSGSLKVISVRGTE